MEEYTDKVNENTLDGSFLRAVIAIKRDDYSKAHSYIQKVSTKRRKKSKL